MEKQEGYAIITLNRPDVLNAMNVQMRSEILDALEDLGGDESVKVVIFTGAGRAFCAGVDIKDLKSRMPLEARRHRRLGGTEPFNSVAQFLKPTIAAINGFAVGGGCELAL